MGRVEHVGKSKRSRWSTMKRLLITGASGFLGWNLARRACARYSVQGAFCAHELREPGIDAVRLDLTRPEDVRRCMAASRPDAVIHTAGYPAPNQCELHPELSFRLNVEATAELAARCAANGIPFVFTSTDSVFDGRHPPYAEDAPVSPINVYGRHKAEAEQRILAVHPGAVVCRMPLMFGRPGPFGSSFIQPWLASLAKGETLRLFVDEHRTVVSAAAAAEGLLLALERSSRGLLHLGGQERVSRFEFGTLLAETFGFPAALIQPARQADIPMAAQRPPDVSLDSRRAFRLGYRPGPLARQLAAFKETDRTCKRDGEA